MSSPAYLKNRRGPRRSDSSGERKFGYSEDDEIKEKTVGELMEGIASKDHNKMMSAFKALIEYILSKESSDE